ncbi:MAG: hypothetical protein KatS3mg087_0092 [Patescibacteria group bacterium]|nr:MAG: hypothetical protein KatS3mg087_0092 [Patescibacteria group bacterium]
MAVEVYPNWAYALAKKIVGWNSLTVCYGMLEEDTSTYTYNGTHSTVKDLINNGFIEHNTPGYIRGRLPQPVTTQEGNTIKLQGQTINFGRLDSGHTIKGMVLVQQLGATINTDIDIPILYITDPPFPMSTDGRYVFATFPDAVIKIIVVSGSTTTTSTSAP